MLTLRNIEILKRFVVVLLFLLSISQIFNIPGSPFLENFKRISLEEPYEKLVTIYPPSQLTILSQLIKSYNNSHGPLFYNSDSWQEYKFLQYGSYLIPLAILLFLSHKRIIKVTKTDICLYYFGSISLLYFNLSYSYPDIFGTTLFLISMILLIKKKGILSLFIYLLSLSFSYSLVVFLPAYLIFQNKRLNREIVVLITTFALFSFLFHTDHQVLGHKSVFNLHFLVRLSTPSQQYPKLIFQTISENLLTLVFFASQLYLTFKFFYLKKYIENPVNVFIAFGASYALFSANTADIVLYWLPFISLIYMTLNPSRFSRINLVTVNLMVFLNMFLLHGPSGVNSLSGVTYEFFKSLIAFVNIIYLFTLLKLFASRNIRDKSELLKKFCVIILILTTFAIFTAQGSPDTVAWAEYAHATAQHLNPFYAQTQIDQRYPPLSTVIIGIFSNLWKYTLGFSEAKIGQVISQDYAFSTKVSIVFFYFLSIFTFIKVTRKKTKVKKGNYLFITLTVISLFIQTQGLADVNIHLIPTLLLAAFLMFKKKYFWCGLLMGATISIKWQPVILIPVFLATTFDLKGGFKKAVSNTLKFIVGMIPVPVVSWILILIQPGSDGAIERGFSYLIEGAPMLSGQAMNLNWIVTYFLHIYKPEEVYSLAHLEGLNRQIFTLDAPYIFQGLFFLIFGAAIILFFWLFCKKSLRSFMATSAMIFFTHQILNRSAYEKHLIYTVIFILLVYLIKPNKGNRILLILVDLMAVINLIFFYGLVGPKDINRMFMGMDLTVIFSAIYVLIYAYVLYLYVKSKGLFFGDKPL